MYIRPEQIAEQYEMEVKSISKGRDCFLCETDLGMRALKEYRGSVERAEFLAGMLDFLKGQNIVAEQIFYSYFVYLLSNRGDWYDCFRGNR